MGSYTDYCTCFYDESTGFIYFYDEIEDRIIKKEKAADKKSAKTTMETWVNNAPEGVICQILED